MMRPRAILMPCVKLLTLSAALLLSACSLIRERYAETCNSHAYTQTVLVDHVSSRYPADSPVRMGIIPFTVPANLAAVSAEKPGLGSILAWKTQANLMQSGRLPIVEVLNRQDWPGKREEFFTGNFGAIANAREAGYDLVLVGHLEPLRSMDSMTVEVKVIETESGITLYYGRSVVSSMQPELASIEASFGIASRTPARLASDSLVNEMAACIAESVLEERPAQ